MIPDADPPSTKEPTPRPVLDYIDLMMLERATLNRLRTDSGWYVGDAIARIALQDYAKVLLASAR